MKKLYFFLILSFALSLSSCKSKEIPLETDNENPSTSAPQTISELITEKNVPTELLKLDTTKCKEASLSVKTYKETCTSLSEMRLTPSLTVKAFEVIPEGAKDEAMIPVGETVNLEFYEEGEKLDIPAQNFTSSRAEDFLTLGLSFQDEEHIYVYGSGVDKVEYGYFYDGNEWEKVK